MNHYGVMDMFGLIFFLAAIISLYFLRKRHELSLVLLLPYFFLMLAVLAAYIDGRGDWYMLLFCLPLVCLLQVVLKSRL